jgi:hypothetical protein
MDAILSLKIFFEEQLNAFSRLSFDGGLALGYTRGAF